MSEVYQKDGRTYDRVTTVLASYIELGLVEWKMEVGRVAAGRISSKSLKDGKRVDELVMSDISKGDYKLRKSDNPEVVSCMKGWELFKKEKGDLRAISTQVTCYDDTFGTAGTYDIEYPDTLCDLKAGKRINKKYWLQVAWYNHISKLDKPFLSILRLDPFWGTYQYLRRPMNPAYLRVFQGVLEAMRYFNHEGDIE